MLTRNLDLHRGLVNGAEVQLMSMRDFSITVRMASGQLAVLPRISFTAAPEESGLPFYATQEAISHHSGVRVDSPPRARADVVVRGIVLPRRRVL